MQSDFVMAMWSRGTTGAADSANLFATRDVLADFHVNAGHVAVSSRDAVTVVNDDYVAITAKHSRKDDDSIRSEERLWIESGCRD